MCLKYVVCSGLLWSADDTFFSKRSLPTLMTTLKRQVDWYKVFVPPLYLPFSSTLVKRNTQDESCVFLVYRSGEPI
jgi:hypothetical protein